MGRNQPQKRPGGKSKPDRSSTNKHDGITSAQSLQFAFALLVVIFAAVAIRFNISTGYGNFHYSDGDAEVPLGPPDGFKLLKNSVPVKTISPDKEFATSTVAGGRPIILRNSVVSNWKARNQWSVGYLKKRIHGPLENVYENANRWFGPYFDRRKPLLPYTHRPNPYRTDLTLSTKEFIHRLHALSNRTSMSSWIYYSGPLESIGDWAIDDVSPLSELLKPNPAVSSVNIWIGPPQVIAHCHYDGYHNFYAQLVGRKRFWLGHPKLWSRLRSAPFLHPMHAQCQVNLSQAGPLPGVDPNTQDSLDAAELLEVVLQPGDLLYIPPLWFHHVESVDVSVSVNVWTDSIQSELAMKMFEQPLPGEHLLEGLDVATRAHLAVATVKEVVTAVYKDIENSSEEDQQESSLPQKGTRGFISQLYSARYQPMMQNGLLRLPSQQWETPLCQMSTTKQVLEANLDSQYTAFVKEATGFSKTVAEHARKIPAQTRMIWVGNFVEFTVAQYLDAEQVGHWLKDAIECV